MAMSRSFRILACLCGLLAFAGAARAETVRIAQQYGISYLPLMVMRDAKLLEAEGRARGLDLAPDWITFTGGTPINEALISGNLDFASGGVGPLLTIWAKTRSNLRVKGVAALNAMPIWLTTSNSAVKSIRDFTDKDRIALPAIKVSIQAVVLQMAAEQAFGKGQADRLDAITVAMGHPDAYAALMAGKTEIDAHFGSAPYMYDELKDARIHRVLNSYDVLGGPHTFNVVWATTRYHDAHPKVVAAFIAALEDAMKLIAEKPQEAAAAWMRVEHPKMSEADAVKMMQLPENEWTTTPKQIMHFADFMHATGAINAVPAGWQDAFFPEIGAAHGS
jgi:NitT/TauT family transport system substrate-binding protein